MKRDKDNKYGYSSWSMEEVIRFGRFFLLPLLVVVLIVFILMMDKKKDSVPEESVEVAGSLESEESSAEEETNSLPPEQAQMFTPNSVPEVNDLVNRYFAAKEKADASAIYQLFGWTIEMGQDGLQRQLQYDARYTEGYRNIVCYTTPGEIEGTYLERISYDLKFKNSLTLAPGFQWSYVRTGADGNLYLTVEDELSEPEKAFVQEALAADEIVLLRVEIYAKLRAALESDPLLAESYGILEKKGGSAGTGQAEQHEANVQIDGIPSAGNESQTSQEENTEDTGVAQDEGNGGGTVDDAMIHIEGSAGAEDGESAAGTVPESVAGENSTVPPEGALEGATGAEGNAGAEGASADGNGTGAAGE